MNVTGKSTVFYNQNKDGREYYSISDGSRNVDGDWTNKSWNVRFKGEAPQNKEKIEFEGFTTYYKASNGNIYTTIQIMEWKYVDQNKNGFEFNEEMVKKIEEDKMPF